MALSVPAANRGEFHYRDTLFVSIGSEGDKNHPRAPESEIRDLLDGKIKDRFAHFYEAQCVHYGLQRSRDKNRAKVILQQTLAKGELKEQPAALVQLEAELKKEYAGNVRKAKAAAKAETSGEVKPATKAASMKRKNDETVEESGKRTKISVNVDGISISIDHASEKKSTKKTAATTTQTSNTTTTPTEPAGKAKVKAVTSKSATAVKTAAPTKGDGKSAKAPAKTAPVKSPANGTAATPKSKSKAEPKVKQEGTAKSATKVKAEPKVTTETKVKSETKVKAEPKIKKEKTVKKEPGMPAFKTEVIDAAAFAYDDQPDFDNTLGINDEMPQHSVTGFYTIYSDQIAQQVPEEADNLRLFLCEDRQTDTIWGGFQIAHKSGVIRIDGNLDDIHWSFAWRSRDADTGELRFGRGCEGGMAWEDGEVRGEIVGMFPGEPITFAGCRRPGPLWCGRSAYSFRQEWDGFVQEAYGR